MKNKYTIIGVIGIILLISLGLFIWSYNSLPQEEKYKIVIDEYNFEQLEKVKKVLDGLDKNSYRFWGLEDFNKEFVQNIIPIKNCYYLVDRNHFYENREGGGGYIFGFKLESDTYIEKYGTEYYAYPKFDLPKIRLCTGMGDSKCQADKWYLDFKRIIGKTCEE